MNRIERPWLDLRPHFKPIHERSSVCKNCGRRGSEHSVADELACFGTHCLLPDTCHPDPEKGWCSCRCSGCEPYRAPVVASTLATSVVQSELPPVILDWGEAMEAWRTYADEHYGECWWETRSDRIRVQKFSPEREAAHDPFIDAFMLARGWRKNPVSGGNSYIPFKKD